MAPAKKETQKTEIKINPIKLQRAKITIVGDTPLLIHAWTEKAKRQMLEAQQNPDKGKKKSNRHEIRDPFSEFMNELYWVTPKPEESTPEAFEKAIAEGAKFGFPLIAIKKAAMSACYRAGIISNQMGMRTTFYLNTEDNIVSDNRELAIIDTPEPPECQEDMVTVQMSADLRYRPVFRKWKIHLIVTLVDVGLFTMESIINALNMGGTMCGIGEWRMEKDGDYGRFHVEVDE